MAYSSCAPICVGIGKALVFFVCICFAFDSLALEVLFPHLCFLYLCLNVIVILCASICIDIGNLCFSFSLCSSFINLLSKWFGLAFLMFSSSSVFSLNGTKSKLA